MHWASLIHLLLLFIWATAEPSLTKPGCRETCGNISIPYPFGTGSKYCFLDTAHKLTCNESSDPPVLLLGQDNNIPILNISLEGQLTVTHWVAYDCYSKLGNSSRKFNRKIQLPDSYTYSDTRNMFTAIGCDTRAFISDPKSNVLQSGCVALCGSPDNVMEGSCSGIGCCQTAIPKGLTSLNMDLGSYYNHTKSWDFNPCSYAFLGDQEMVNFSLSDLANFTGASGLVFQNQSSVPVILDWTIGPETCEEILETNLSSYACGKNSYCSDSTNGPGYRCYCKQGYQGNPYLANGCQDIDECADPNNNPCEGFCVNTPGSFICTCPHGTIDDGKKDGIRCIPRYKQPPILQVALGVGLALLFLLLAGSWIYWCLKKRKLIQLKEKFFEQNGGLLLQQQLLMREWTVETTKIFTAEELKNATNNYAENRILGHGGYGTVYKGILPNNRTVAIKKSKIVDKDQIDQFINEVFILSQINHNNVVKLLGCCLETEVPLLVYEFITNGTLYEHIHDHQDHTSIISWENRLRIAAETAGALAYLHSAASPPIIHRDIKSSNILLDKMHRAKVADFGASRLIPLDQTQLNTLVQGTLGYLDPEYFLTGQLTEKSDVYSFGVVLAELLIGQKAISFDRPQEQRNLAMYFISSMKEDRLFEILERRVLDEASMEQVLIIATLAKRCLKLNGEERPSMKEVAMELESLRITKERHWGSERARERGYIHRKSSYSHNSSPVDYDSVADDRLLLSLDSGR